MSSPPKPPTPPPPNYDSVNTQAEKLAAAPSQPDPGRWVSFAGTSTESVTSFIHSVHRVAFLFSRVEDDKWIAHYASTCFLDSALVWYIGLGEETRFSWEKLRTALVNCYPVQSAAPRIGPKLAIQPATSKATSPATSGTAAIPTDEGVIEVRRPVYGDLFGYLSRDVSGKFVMDRRPEKALKLKKIVHPETKYNTRKFYNLKLVDVRSFQYKSFGGGVR
ncbi:hypothetical protein FS837_011364 [Tulasnella sp. UAMH 9824]|nr:hypothetical protein FS837_011364 [Tulasnella sp. UAMH 9824]